MSLYIEVQQFNSGMLSYLEKFGYSFRMSTIQDRDGFSICVYNDLVSLDRVWSRRDLLWAGVGHLVHRIDRMVSILEARKISPRLHKDMGIITATQVRNWEARFSTKLTNKNKKKLASAKFKNSTIGKMLARIEKELYQIPDTDVEFKGLASILNIKPEDV